MPTHLKVGDLAPDFSVLTNGGNTFSLSACQGNHNVVLYFYPKDDTPGCTMEACNFASLFPEFSAEDTIIAGVSLDSVVSHDRFAKKHDLPFRLLADENGEVCNLYGVLPEGSTCPERVTFVIDKTGRIAHIYDDVKVDTHSREVLEALPE